MRVGFTLSEDALELLEQLIGYMNSLKENVEFKNPREYQQTNDVRQTDNQTTQDNRYQPIPPQGTSDIARGMGLLNQMSWRIKPCQKFINLLQ